MIHRFLLICATILGLGLCVLSAQAQALPAVKAVVDIPSQTVRVYVDGQLKYGPWPTSTASARHTDCTYGPCKTPVGRFNITSINPMAYAPLKFGRTPMPHTAFFDNEGDGFHAAYGAAEMAMLGREDSHGCARLAPENAKILFDLIKLHEVWTGRYDRNRNPTYAYPGVTVVIIGRSPTLLTKA